jgi:phosphotransferase system HPr (HPr) family protein
MMKTRSVVLQCEHGLHGRVAAQVVKLAKDHQSSVHIHCSGCARADACSILQLMCLGANEGTRLSVVAEGPDEDAVVDALTDVFHGGSGI